MLLMDLLGSYLFFYLLTRACFRDRYIFTFPDLNVILFANIWLFYVFNTYLRPLFSVDSSPTKSGTLWA